MDVETLRHFKVGFVTGSLKSQLGAGQAKALGALFNEKGNERFYLRVAVPIFDDDGTPVGLYGRSIQPDNATPHLYLPGGHRGVWNSIAAAAHPDELLVTEAMLDGLAIFAAGKHNVTSTYGADGWQQTLRAKVKVETFHSLEVLLAQLFRRHFNRVQFWTAMVLRQVNS